MRRRRAVAAAGTAAVAAAARRSRSTGTLIQGGLIARHRARRHHAADARRRAVPLAADGRFLIAFDRDAGAERDAGRDRSPTARQVAETLADRAARVADRAADDAARASRRPTPMFAAAAPARARRRSPPRARSATDAQGWRQRFLLAGDRPHLRPVRRRSASTAASPAPIIRASTSRKPTGTPVLAPADGVVILAADHPFTLEGNLLMIDHGMGLNSAFLHLSRIDVRVGAAVRQGEPIGAGRRDRPRDRPASHWGMSWREARLDPLLVAGPMPAE